MAEIIDGTQWLTTPEEREKIDTFGRFYRETYLSELQAATLVGQWCRGEEFGGSVKQIACNIAWRRNIEQTHETLVSIAIELVNEALDSYYARR